jgi:AcrR family transcriptional regulator
MASRAGIEETKAPANGRLETLAAGLEEIFLCEGYRRMTVGELAARLHCSRRSLYVLAPSKEELFLLTLDRMLGRMMRLSRTAAQRETDSPAKIEAYVRPQLTEATGATASFFADIESLPNAKRRLEEHQAACRRELEELIEEGVRCGECRRVHAAVAAQLMIAGYRAVTDADYLATVAVSSSDAVREATDLLLYGLLHPEDERAVTRAATARGSVARRREG